MNGKTINIEIITGSVNSGKTTELIKLVEELKLKNQKVAGFISHSIFEQGEKIGYSIEDIATKEFFHLAQNKPSSIFQLKQGRFYFNEDLFTMLNNRLESFLHYSYIVIDEIGPLELRKKGFYNGLIFLLNHYDKNLVLVTRKKLEAEVKFLINS